MVNRFMNVDALDRDTDLAGMGEGSGDAAGNGFVKIGVGFDDDGGVRSEFESDALHAGEIAEALTDVGAPCERDHGDAGVEGEGVADNGAGPGDDVERARRQPRFVKDLREEQCADGCGGGWFVNDRVARGDGGSDLMQREVEWEVERGDGRDDAEGLANGDAGFAFAARMGVHGNFLAVEPVGLLGGEEEREDAAVDFCARLTDGLAGFGGDDERYFFAAFGEDGLSFGEDGGAFVAGRGAHGGAGFSRGFDGGFDVFGGCLVDGSGYGVVEGDADGLGVGCAYGFASDPHRVVGGVVSHGFSLVNILKAQCPPKYVTLTLIQTSKEKNRSSNP